MASWAKRDDMVVHEVEPYNAEPPRRGLLGRRVTSVEAFYARNHGPIPDVDLAGWRLTVDGLVDRPCSWTLEELRRDFDWRTLTATLQCAGNRRAGLMAVRDIPGEDPWGPCAISTATWAGVALAEVLAAAGVKSGAAHVGFSAPDVSDLATPTQTYGGSIPRRKAEAAETLVALEMNGAPLPRLHGAPARIVVPGYIGARSVKWVERITALSEPSDNFFQATAYRVLPADADPDQAGPGDGISLGPLALNSEILTPDDGDHVPPGACRVAGYALAGGDRTVSRVDCSTDEGSTWIQAELDPPTSPWAWQMWQADVHLEAGPADIVARAWDSTAAVQPEDPRHLWNPKGYANNSWARVHITVDPS